jgi:hypothetical protein
MRWNELFCPKETKHGHDVWWVSSGNEWYLKVEYIKHNNSSLNTFLHIIYFISGMTLSNIYYCLLVEKRNYTIYLII